ncbi:hypothetical protein MMC28_007153 [Mycoblastus sanguinarius]|nr:hypothetical protein [Mycoblastus sanguinarius]
MPKWGQLPWISSLCQSSRGLANPSSSSNLSVTTAATVAVPAPTNAMTGSNRDCGNWYTIISGDTCGLVSVANYLSLSDFYFLNPEIYANCSNLDLRVAYCVEPVSDISTYPGYTMTSGVPTITVAPVSFAFVNTAITTPTPQSGFHYAPSYLPKAPGTLSNCYAYHNHNVCRENDCSYIAFLSNITTDQLIKWNPSLSSNLSSCSLQSGYSYCTAQNNGTTVDASSDCTPIDTTEIVSGTLSHCDCFLQLAGYESGEYMCEDIESDYSVTASQLTTWNTWLGSDCDTNLYANLLVNETRPVCVGVNASEPIGSAAPGPSKKPSQAVSASGTKTVSIGPTASGEVAGCEQFYTVKSGDSCTNIETTYGISFTQFYAWNPSIGKNCENLWLGYAYCVQGPASSGSASPTAPASAPRQSGIAANCDAYYTVAGGDSCAKIETQYNDTFAELYSWNPAIGNNCQNLWVGYAICVGVS